MTELDPNYLSNCHNAPVYVVGDSEGTNHYNCSECNKLCNFHAAKSELEKAVEEILSEYGANRALAYRNYGDKPPYSTDAENLKAKAKQSILALIQDEVRKGQEDFARELWDIRFCNNPKLCSAHQYRDLDMVFAKFLVFNDQLSEGKE